MRKATDTQAERQRVVEAETNRIATTPGRHPIAQSVQLFKPQTGNVGGRGALPLRSLGGLRGPFSHAREWPPYPRPLHGAGKNAPCEYAGNNTTQCVKTMLTGSFQAIPQTRPARAAGRYASATACCSRGKTPPPM